MTLHASTCLSYQDVPWTRVVHPHQTSWERPVFPVTRQVRRKRTPCFRPASERAGAMRRATGASGGARAPGWAWGRRGSGYGGEEGADMGEKRGWVRERIEVGLGKK